VHYIYSNGLNGPPIRADGYGYYAYLTSLIIDHGLSFSSALSHLPAGTHPVDYGLSVVPETGRMVDRYSLGIAVLELPFFLVAHIYAKLSGIPADGYSGPYQFAAGVSAIFYLLIGTVAIYDTIRRFKSPNIAFVTTALIVFATNVFHYATYDASFSHAYSFALTALLVWLSWLYRAGTAHSRPLLLGMGLVCGLLMLVRTTNAILFLIPVAVLLEAAIADKDYRKALVRSVFLGTMCLVIWAPQIVAWHHATGKWFSNPYHAVLSEAHFNWTRPELINFLFSVRKGALFWTPLILLSLLGYRKFVSQAGIYAVSVGVVLLLQVYVCASWYCWFFGGSYGSRPMVDVMPLIAFQLSIIASNLLEKRRYMVLALSSMVLIGINLLLMFSYWQHFIPYDESDIQTLVTLPAKLRTLF
jgi:hypothetical protein